jgi:hypothetical protein
VGAKIGIYDDTQLYFLIFHPYFGANVEGDFEASDAPS